MNRTFTFCIDIPIGDFSSPITILSKNSKSYITERCKKIHIPIFWQIKKHSLQRQNKTESLRLFGTRLLNHVVTWSNTHQFTTVVNCFKKISPGVKPRRRNRDDKWPRAAQNYTPTGRRVRLRGCCKEDYEAVQSLSCLIPQDEEETDPTQWSAPLPQQCRYI
jgi:hypothetical protein